MDLSNYIIHTKVHGDVVIVNTYSIEYIFSLVENLLIKYPIIAEYLSYDMPYEILTLLNIKLGNIDISIKRALIFYFIGTKCSVSGVEATKFAVYYNLKAQLYHLDLIYDHDNGFTIDHINPHSKSNLHNIENLQPMLFYYNNIKGSNDSVYDHISDNITDKDISIVRKMMHTIIDEYNKISKRYSLDNGIYNTELVYNNRDIIDGCIIYKYSFLDDFSYEERISLMEETFSIIQLRHSDIYFNKNNINDKLRQKQYFINNNTLTIKFG